MTDTPEPVDESEVELVDVELAEVELAEVQVGADDPFGALGGLDMGSLLGAAQNMQAQLLEAQERMATTVVEGQAGGGAVRIEVTGGLEFRAVHIDAGAVDPDDPTLLEDLVLAALHDAVARVNELQADASPLGGLDLGGLFGGA